MITGASFIDFPYSNNTNVSKALDSLLTTSVVRDITKVAADLDAVDKPHVQVYVKVLVYLI
jgi:hypothetical protein